MADHEEVGCDIVIIGGGVAGLAAARYCLQQGVGVVVIDSAFPGKRFKGADTAESIHPGVETLLRSLDLDGCLQHIMLGEYSFIKRDGIKNSVNPYSDEIWNGFHISKQGLMMEMKRKIIDHHATVMHDQVVNLVLMNGRVGGVVLKSGTRVSARYTIDASGNSRVGGKNLKFRQKFYSPPLVATTGFGKDPGSCLEPGCAEFISSTTGWTWVAPLSNNDFYWTSLTTKEFLESLNASIASRFRDVTISRMSNVRWRVFRPLCSEGLLLAGEAACLLDPAAGQGILNAITSGIMAARTAINCTINPQHENLILAGYDDWLITTFEKNASRLKEYYLKAGMHGLQYK